MFGILKAALMVAPSIISVARKAPVVVDLIGDVVKSSKLVASRHPDPGADSAFAESALTIVAYAAAQFKTEQRARACGAEHGRRITVRMNAKIPGWEVAEDNAFIPYLEGLIEGLKSDG